MVEIKISDRKAMAYIKGSTEEIAAELAVAITGIHQQIKAQDGREAASFRRAMRKLMAPDSPVWTEIMPGVAIDAGKLKK